MKRSLALLVNAVRPDVIRLAPPLILTEADVDAALPRLSQALAAVERGRQ
jgi:acetylornithine aminotransferase